MCNLLTRRICMKPTFKRLLSGVLSMTMLMSAVPSVSVFAEDTSECYPYTLFASSTDEGAITVNAGNFCVNGNVAVNGTISSSGNMNINGVREEEAGLEMLYIFNRLDTTYFSSDNVEVHEEDYTLEEMNININSPLEIVGEAELTGNININSALKAFKNVELYGEVKNTNDSVIYSKYGDIIIDSANVNLNGLVYAPFGNVVVTAQNLNLNNVVIIANTITLNCPNVNANYSSSAAELVGTASEPLDIPVEEWAYMKDENENDFPDFFEDMGNWSKLKDSDGDKLPDCVEQYIETNSLNCDTDGDGLDDYYELMILGTDPTLVDTDENGIADGDEDFDEDGLINYEEYNRNTNPWNPDSDADSLLDGDEVNIYHTDPLDKDSDDDGLDDDDEIQLKTDPLNPDSNGNTVLDGEEKYPQAFEHEVLNDCAVDKVVVSMVGTGNLQKTTTVDSVMDEDILCSDVVGLVGEPFEITSTSEFDAESNPATITFYINQNKLGETSFEDLLFLWYDEDNDEFVELETMHDLENSCVSINTAHFSKYMLVDRQVWFDSWSNELHSEISVHDPTGIDTILVIDCSGSMYTNDMNEISRKTAAGNFISSIRSNDRVAILAEDSPPKWLCENFTSDTTILIEKLNLLYSTGGNNFNSSLKECISLFERESSTTHKNIIFMSDGGCSVDKTILQSIKDANIDIFTIGFGENSDDETLYTMAHYTDNGEFYKAITSDELIDIYSKIGTEQFLNYEDTDGDGLPDVFEQFGMTVQNGQTIYTNFEKKDTDDDGLTDSQEIQPKYKKKIIPASITGTEELVGFQFIMNSNPEDSDSDKDGYSDIEDPDRMKTPEILMDGEYNFLNQEIYYINTQDNNCLEVKYRTAGSPLTKDMYTENDKQKFKFEWTGVGYKIHALSNESLVLTLSLNADNSYSVYMGNDLNDQGQLWEILPYDNGIVIRSKILFYNDSNSVGESLYLNYINSEISVSTDKLNNTKFTFASLDFCWKRFGTIYMEYANWIKSFDKDDINRSMHNYKHNLSVGTNGITKLKTSSGIETFIAQNVGAFNFLKYGDDLTMDYNGCGVIATYNALCIANGNNDLDFIKLITEFDVNALLPNPLEVVQLNPLDYFIAKKFINSSIFNRGGLGTNANRIGSCLTAYNKQFDRFKASANESNTKNCNDFEILCKSGKSSIIEIQFQAKHNCHYFALEYDTTKASGLYFAAYNYNGYETATSWDDATFEDSVRANADFLVGYVIY